MSETVSEASGPPTGAHVHLQFPPSRETWIPMGDCRTVCDLNASARCYFVRTNPDCRSPGGYVDYLDGLFCYFPAHLLPLAIFLYVLWLLYLFLILGVTAAKFFCPNLSAISTSLKLSHNVAGVTFLAFGNGAPDIFSALVAFSDPRTAGLAVGALFGAGVLVTTVVAGGIAILRPFTAASRPFLRDISFYMVAVFLTFTACYRGTVTLAWALGCLGLYVFYVATVVLCTWAYRWQQRRTLAWSTPGTPEPASDSEEDPISSSTYSSDYCGEEFRPMLFYQEPTARILVRGLSPLDSRKWRTKSSTWRVLKVLKLPVEFLLLLTVPVVDPDKDDRNWKRPLNCLHLLLSPLVVVLTLHSGTYGVYEIGGLLPVWAVVVVVGTGLASVAFFATSNSEAPRLHWLWAFLGFLTSALWINTAATEVVNVLRSLGVVSRLSNTVLGLTLLAWGNSIGDVFSDFTLARQGYPRMAFSACFGGIIFSILYAGPGRTLKSPVVSSALLLNPRELSLGGLHGEGPSWGWRMRRSGSDVGCGRHAVFLSGHRYAGGCGPGLPAADVQGPPGGEARARRPADVGAGGRPGPQPRLLLVAVPLRRFQLNRLYGGCMLLFYLGFLLLALLTEFGVIHLRGA